MMLFDRRSSENKPEKFSNVEASGPSRSSDKEKCDASLCDGFLLRRQHGEECGRSDMEPTSTLSEKSSAKTGSAPLVVGRVEALDNDGSIFQSWSLEHARCTIGSSSESLVCVHDHSMAAIHALVVFGKNHTLIQAMGGQVRISGRTVREWLIDEPTTIQCGATRFNIYPHGFPSLEKNQSHRVAAGSVSDQASRLRSALHQDIPAVVDTTARLSAEDEVRVPAENSRKLPAEPTFVVAKLDPAEVQTALEPLHRAVQEASDGILAMARAASESALQFSEIPPITNNLSEMSQAIDSLDDRVSTITRHCENLLANVSESIEGRLNQLDEVLARLAELPQTPSPNVYSNEDAYRAQPDFEQAIVNAQPVSYEPLAAFQQPTGYEEEPVAYEQYFTDEKMDSISIADDSYSDETQDKSRSTDQEIEDSQEQYIAELSQNISSSSLNTFDANHFREVTENETFIHNPDFDDSVESDNGVDAATDVKLPAWFTESDSDSMEENAHDELAETIESTSPNWSAAQLNPIYAEDTHRLLAELDDENAGEMATVFSEPDTVQSPQDVADEEESIEDYMSRLLRRVKGTSDDEVRVVPAAPVVSRTPKTNGVESPQTGYVGQTGSISQPEVTSDSVERTSPVVGEFAPGEFAPRKAAPERSENLAALRVLANDTARQAIDNNQRKKLELDLVGKVLIATFGLVGAIVLLCLNGLNANVTMIGMIASFVVFLLWGYDVISIYSKIRTAKAKESGEIAKA